MSACWKEIKPSSSSLNCKPRLWYWIYLTTLFVVVVRSFLGINNRWHRSFKFQCWISRRLCYCWLSQCHRFNKASFLSLNPRKALFVTFRYIFLCHYFVRCISSSCQLCLQNTSRLLTCFATSLPPLWTKPPIISCLDYCPGLLTASSLLSTILSTERKDGSS